MKAVCESTSYEIILQCRQKVIWSSVLWQIVGQYMTRQLLSEEVDLVEKDDEGSFLEEDRVEDLVEELLAFPHSVCAVVLVEHLVEVAQGDDEEDCKDRIMILSDLK